MKRAENVDGRHKIKLPSMKSAEIMNGRDTESPGSAYDRDFRG